VNEYTLVLTFSRGSESTEVPKIIALKEFVDSHFVMTFFPAERERMRKSN
jgi:hypothetical protein